MGRIYYEDVLGKTKYTITKLKKNKTYYIKARAYVVRKNILKSGPEKRRFDKIIYMFIIKTVVLIFEVPPKS